MSDEQGHTCGGIDPYDCPHLTGELEPEYKDGVPVRLVYVEFCHRECDPKFKEREK